MMLSLTSSEGNKLFESAESLILTHLFMGTIGQEVSLGALTAENIYHFLTAQPGLLEHNSFL